MLHGVARAKFGNSNLSLSSRTQAFVKRIIRIIIDHFIDMENLQCFISQGPLAIKVNQSFLFFSNYPNKFSKSTKFFFPRQCLPTLLPKIKKKLHRKK